MHTTLTLLTALNPGPYISNSLIAVWTNVVIIVAFILLAYSILFVKKLWVIAIGVVVALTVLLGGLWLADIAGTDAGVVKKSEYDASVVTWLADEYGVEIETTDAEKLRMGESIAVDYDGRVVAVELIDKAGNEVALQATGGQVLAPVTSGK